MQTKRRDSNIAISADVHQALKMRAAQQGTTIREVSDELLTEALLPKKQPPVRRYRQGDE